MKFLAVVVTALAVLVDAHEHKPDAVRNAHHNRILSESCAARSKKELMQFTGETDESFFSGDTTCLLDPEIFAGPYATPSAPIRSDITEEETGIPFNVKLTLVNSSTCLPIAGAAIEIWHCTVDGRYSSFEEASLGIGTDRDNSTYLRGIQFTDHHGRVNFKTVFPGWYVGRAWHIHVKVHFGIEVAKDDSGYRGGTSAHIGSLFVPDDFREMIAEYPPYNLNMNGKIPIWADTPYLLQGGPFGLMSLAKQNPDGDWNEGINGESSMAILHKDTPEVGIFVLPLEPTAEPTPEPIPVPTQVPTTAPPTPIATNAPSPTPTSMPTAAPTPIQTNAPSPTPTSMPTAAPTPIATGVPTPIQTNVPTASPTPIATGAPTPIATSAPTPIATSEPTDVPTALPTPIATGVPTPIATSAPTPIVTGVPTTMTRPGETAAPTEELTLTRVVDTPAPIEVPVPVPAPADVTEPVVTPLAQAEVSPASNLRPGFSTLLLCTCLLGSMMMAESC